MEMFHSVHEMATFYYNRYIFWKEDGTIATMYDLFHTIMKIDYKFKDEITEYKISVDLKNPHGFMKKSRSCW